MGVFSRPDSKYWWLWLETAPKGQQKVRTDLLIGPTASDRKESRAKAERVYHARMHALGCDRHHLPHAPDLTTFDTFATWYDTHAIARHRGRVRERKILPRLRAAFGTRALSDPDWKTAVIAWRTARLLTPITRPKRGTRPARTYPAPSPSTVNREVGLLKQILSTAAALHHVPSSPLVGLADLPVVTPLRRILREDEEFKILKHLSLVDQAILITGLDTLARFGDILDLRWADDHGDTLDLPDPKNGVPLRVPVSARLRAALDAIASEGSSPYVFARRRRAASEESRHSVFLGALRRACQQAGVPYGRTAHGVTFHWGTRRTGATRMIRQGGEKAIGIVQQIGGWKKVDVLIGIYQEVITAEMRAAVETVAPKPTLVAVPLPFPTLSRARENR